MIGWLFCLCLFLFSTIVGGSFGDAGGVIGVVATEFLQQVRHRIAKLNQTLGGNGDLRTTTLIPSGEGGGIEGTMVQISQESGRKYWATRSSVRSFARTAHSWDSE